MPNIADAFPSKFLKASDLKGAEPVVTIDRVEFEPVGREKEMKAVLYFQGKDKGLVLNKTNANKITELLRSGITEEWEGQRIRLFATETNFGSELVDCIRVKAAARPNGKPAVPVRAYAHTEETTPAPKPEPVQDFVSADELTDDEIPF